MGEVCGFLTVIRKESRRRMDQSKEMLADHQRSRAPCASWQAVLLHNSSCKAENIINYTWWLYVKIQKLFKKCDAQHFVSVSQAQIHFIPACWAVQAWKTCLKEKKKTLLNESLSVITAVTTHCMCWQPGAHLRKYNGSHQVMSWRWPFGKFQHIAQP